MSVDKKKINYVPGIYAHKRPDAAELAEQHIHSWVKRQLKIRPSKIEKAQIQPSCQKIELSCRRQGSSRLYGQK
jgi:hypothetical protein